jgi:hypothetical protein
MEDVIFEGQIFGVQKLVGFGNMTYILSEVITSGVFVGMFGNVSKSILGTYICVR